jgi:hypothetical protein
MSGAANPKTKPPVNSAAPINHRRGVGAQLPVTLDDWHRALGFHKCATCGVPVGNGIPFAWQGRNRWCLDCFWDEDGEIPDLDALEKEP